MTDVKLLLATRNPGKRIEFQELLGDMPVRILIAEDVGLADLDVEETGDTLEENAALKAIAYGRASGLPTVADDSGLFVDALGGRPGVLTARFGGPAKLLDALAGVPEPRTAHFACVITVWTPDGTIEHVEGVCPGRIATSMRGSGGFGYDPVFMPDGYMQTFAEMGTKQKHPISHRGIAVARILPVLHRVIGQL